MFSIASLVTLLSTAQQFVKNKILSPVNNPFNQINAFFSAQLLKAKEQGTKDGTDNIPKPNDESTFEKKLVSLMRSTFNQSAAQAMGHLHSLGSTLDAIHQEVLQSKYIQACVRIEDAFKNEVEILRVSIAQFTEIIRGYRNTFDFARTEAVRPGGQTDGIGYFIKHPTLIYIVLTILGFLDLPFSVSALEQMNFDSWETRIVALAIVVAVAVLSHFSGLYLKRYKTKARFFWMTFIPVLLFVLFASVIRYTASSEFATSSGLDFDFNTEAPNLGIVDRVTAFEFGEAFQDPNFWFFIIMNFIILLVGILFSYYVHDSNSNFEQAWHDVEVKLPRIQAKISKIESEIADKEALAKISIGQNAILIDGPLTELVTHYEETLDAHNQIGSFVNTLQQDIEDKYLVVINEYREYNLRHRTDTGYDIRDEPIALTLSRIPLRENNILRFFK